MRMANRKAALGVIVGCWLVLSVRVDATPVVLENALVRVEIEPRTFTVRFLGAPGGKNFLDPVYLTATEVAGEGWIEPGGLIADVLPAEENSALLRRGPAEVVAHEDDYLLLLGPEDPATQWRIKKEFYLAAGAPEVRFKLTLLSARKDERNAGVRITAQVLRAGSLDVPRAAGALGLTSGEYDEFKALHDQAGERYMIPLAGTGRRRALVESDAPEVTLSTPFGHWTRQVEIMSAGDVAPGQRGARLLVLLDDTSHSAHVAMEVVQGGVNVGAPLVVQERWILSAGDP